MKITIVGAGAIGGIVGGYLTRGGCDVILIDTAEDHVKAMQKNGLTILTKEETLTIPVKAFTVEEYLKTQEEPLECVLLSVKTQFTRSALQPFLSRLNENSFVVSLQNGMNGSEIAEMIGAERTLLGFVNIFADYMEPGVVNYGGKGALVIGELSGEITHRLSELQKELRGLDRLEISDNIVGYLWAKAGYSAILRATTLTNETIADVIDNPRYREMLMDLASEPLELAVKEGIRLMPFDDWEPGDAYPRDPRDLDQMNRNLDRHVRRLRTYTKVHSGVWRDIVIRKRKIEIHDSVDSLVEKGRKYGLTFPLYTLLYELLFQVERGEREFSRENLEILLEKDQEIYHRQGKS